MQNVNPPRLAFCIITSGKKGVGNSPAPAFGTTIGTIWSANALSDALQIPKRQNNDPHTLFFQAFSGGGTRAAAFSFGVLEELRRTEIVINGQPRRLIDEVDIITGVSGGAFTALAYALHGERLFSEYEQRFLKRNVQGTLLARAINPLYWPRYIGGSAGRSELAADYYDEILFEGATFADLLDKQTPFAIATGTNVSTGSRLAFSQVEFDLLCSDLSKVRLSRAAATSSAVPVVFSAVTFNTVADPKERDFFMNLPTSFVLPDEDVDRLREVAGRLMHAGQASINRHRAHFAGVTPRRSASRSATSSDHLSNAFLA